jgi:hypothetical protein
LSLFHQKNLIERLKGMGAPENFVSTRLHKVNDFNTLRIDRDEYIIYPSIKKYHRLIPPIDWVADPHQNRSWVSLFHSLRFLGSLIYLGDTSDLVKAKFIALDWIRQNPIASDSLSQFAWAEKIVGDRVQVLAYLFRILLGRGELTDDELDEFLNSLIEHGQFLMDDSNYHFNQNHGLAQDIGLYVLGEYLSSLNESGLWREKALTRFIDGVSRQVSPMGVHLEHSPSYHFIVHNWIKSFYDMAKKYDRVESVRIMNILVSMEASAGWFVTPSGTVLPIGDSGGSAKPWVLNLSSQLEGGVVLDAGYGIYKKKSSYLMVRVAATIQRLTSRAMILRLFGMRTASLSLRKQVSMVMKMGLKETM